MGSITDFLAGVLTKVLTNKYPNLPAEVPTKIGAVLHDAEDLVANVIAIVVAIRNTPKS